MKVVVSFISGEAVGGWGSGSKPAAGDMTPGSQHTYCWLQRVQGNICRPHALRETVATGL